MRRIDTIVFGGNCSGSEGVARAIAQELESDYRKVYRREFTDTELLVKIPLMNGEDKGDKTFKDKHIIYVQSTAPAQTKHMMELFLTVDTLKRKKGASILDLVVPYLAHARQDKEFNPGEAVSTETILGILKFLAVDRLFTVDVHFHREPGPFPRDEEERKKLMGIRGYNITAAGALADYVREHLSVKHPIAVIPDRGGQPISRIVSERLVPQRVIYLSKMRTEENISILRTGGIGNLRGNDVVVFDDIISTGKTIVEAVKYLKENGAERIILAATHALYLDGARQRIIEAGVDEIVSTDTVESEDGTSKLDRKVPVAPIIAGTLKRVAIDAPMAR